MQEIQRLVVRFPESTYYYNEPLYLPLVYLDAGVGVSFLAEGGASMCDGVALQLPYQVIACATRRARMLIEGSLSVPGTPKMTPQQYIQDWRRALASAITPAELTEMTGSTIMFEGQLDLKFEEAEARQRPEWGPKMTLPEILKEVGKGTADESRQGKANERSVVRISSLKEGGAGMAMALQWLARYEKGDPRMATFCTRLLHPASVDGAGAHAREPAFPTGQVAGGSAPSDQLALF